MSHSKPSIKSAEFKAGWAKKHLDALKERVKRFAEKEAQAPTTEDDLAAGHFVVTLWASEPPIDAALIFGDFICSLRSALDHLAYQLARVKGKPSRDTCFPIRGDNTLEAQIAITKATFGFPDEAITLLRVFQPYHHGKEFKLKHLWRLHQLWNIDKHRIIALHSTALDWRIPIALTQPVAIERFDDHVKMRFPLSVKEQMHLYPRPTIDVQFGDDEEGVVVVTSDLVEIYQYVAEGVIPMFKDFFPV